MKISDTNWPLFFKMSDTDYTDSDEEPHIHIAHGKCFDVGGNTLCMLEGVYNFLSLQKKYVLVELIDSEL